MPSVEPEIIVVNVFTDLGRGGNPCPIALDAASMSTEQMQAVARRYGHESAFLIPPADRQSPHRLRYFVPAHEMEMCGHATLGTGWLLRERGLVPPSVMTFQTLAGEVTIDLLATHVRISQPCARVEPLDAAAQAAVLGVLNLSPGTLANTRICNASTTRPKTLIPLASAEVLDGLQPRFEEMALLCERIGSTGLYPFVQDADDPLTFHARQFPKASGYPEDAATGIAATALFGALPDFGIQVPVGGAISVRQGKAMGRPSLMYVERQSEESVAAGCWLSGDVTLEAPIRCEADKRWAN